MSHQNPQRRRLEFYQLEGENRYFNFWFKFRNPLRIFLNFLIIALCKYLPPLPIKNSLYRAIGIKVGKNVFIGWGVEVDAFFPELIEIGDNSLIGSRAILKTHELTAHEWRKGPIKIGKNVLIGACTLVLPGVEVGDEADISAMSLVDRDVAPYVWAEGVPIHKVLDEKSGGNQKEF